VPKFVCTISAIFAQVALDARKRVFTWGFGGYGRLGHSEQKDEHTPRLVQAFDRNGRGAVQVYAGYSFSLALNEMGEFRSVSTRSK